MKNKIFDFGTATQRAINGKIVKRKCIKNDTVIISYKKRLYQLCQFSGIRYPYVPTNADIHAKDWMQVILTSTRGNTLVDQNYKNNTDCV